MEEHHRGNKVNLHVIYEYKFGFFSVPSMNKNKNYSSLDHLYL